MKKLLYTFVMLSLISLSACGGKSQSDKAKDADSLSDSSWIEGPVKADTTIIDSVAR